MSPADGSAAPAVVMLLARDLVDSPYQPPGRSERGIEDLAASIAVHGIIEPLIVRRRPSLAAFEIVCGHRRRAAAVHNDAGVSVGCIVYDMTDEEAAIIVLVENGARLDLTPLEEADIMYGLLERKLSVEAIAEKISKSVSTVRRRLLLLPFAPCIGGLVEEGRDALARGHIRLAVAEQIGTLMDEKAQRAALRDVIVNAETPGFDPMSPYMASGMVNRYRLTLTNAPWSIADMSLHGGACSLCPKRSGAQAALFEEGVDATDRCLDFACWETKRKENFEKLNAKPGDEDEDEESGPEAPEKDPSRARAPTPPVKPAVDLEPQAREAAIEKALPMIAKKIASPKRDLADPRLWKMIVGLVLRGVWGNSGAQILARRGLPMELGAALTAIGQMPNAHEAAGLLVELLCSAGPLWTGQDKDETPTSAAARFCKVDLMKLKSEASEELRAEAKPPAKKSKAAKTEGCRVCGCTDAKPCDTGAGRHCVLSGDPQVCSLCDELGVACEDMIDDTTPAPEEDEVLAAVFEGCEAEGVTLERVRQALLDRMVHPKGMLKIERVDGVLVVRKRATPKKSSKGSTCKQCGSDQHVTDACPYVLEQPSSKPADSDDGSQKTAEKHARATSSSAPPSPGSKEEPKTLRAKLIKGTVHHTYSPSARNVVKLCAAAELAAKNKTQVLPAFFENPLSKDVNCDGCKAAYAAGATP